MVVANEKEAEAAGEKRERENAKKKKANALFLDSINALSLSRPFSLSFFVFRSSSLFF